MKNINLPLLWISVVMMLACCRADLNLTSPVTDPLYISARAANPLNVSLGVTLDTPQNQVFVEMQINQRNSPASEEQSQFVVPTGIVCPSTGCSASYQVSASIGLPLVTCNTRYNETLAIRFFLDSYLLPCHKPCWYGSGATFQSLQNAVLSEFAGVDQYSSVLSRGDFPVSSCLLGFYFRSNSADFSVLKQMLGNLQVISYADSCPQLTGFLRGKKSIGCARIRISVQMPSKVLSADVYRDTIFTPVKPNSAPQISGSFRVSDLELNVQTSLGPLTLVDSDADYIRLTIMSNGLITVPRITQSVSTDPSAYLLPPYTPVFSSGGFDSPSRVIDVNATLAQATRILLDIRLMGLALGPVFINITANDMGRTGFAAVATSLQAVVAFSFTCKPSIRPPAITIFNSDETFRIDWRPGMRYMKRGRLTGVGDEFFPCGGDTMRGFVSFPQGGTGDGPVGWRGAIPVGGGSSRNLTRDCERQPSAFFPRGPGSGARSMYLTLDEGGRARAFIQAAVAPSGCEETEEWRVTLAIQNANYSRTDIPIANASGYHMDWFECRSGAWFCAQRSPRLSLDNSTGALRNLTFWYDQVHRHLGDGVGDYRMTFSGPRAAVRAALANITVEFPWLDISYDGRDQIPPWPFESWPRTGRTFLGSNILRMRVEDVPAEYGYDARADRMWTVDGAYKILRLLDLAQARAECNRDLSCYGFQWLTSAQRQQVFDQQQYPSMGFALSAGKEYLAPGQAFAAGLGFSDRPPYIWGLGWSHWDGLNAPRRVDWTAVLSPGDLPNAFFYRQPFGQFDIQPYSANAMTYTKVVQTRRCLGQFPYAERALDIRLLSEPINTPPTLTVEKPLWLIQQAYELPLSGLRVWDEDARRYPRGMHDGRFLVTLLATRGGFTNPDKAGVEYVVGSGSNDSPTQAILCEYSVCQRVLRELRYQSASEAGQDTVTVTVNDRGYSGELGAQEGSIAITLRLAAGPYNIPPTVSIPGLPARVTHLTACGSRDYAQVSAGSNLSCVLGERVDINGISVGDLDINQPRWDKLYPRGKMTVTISISSGYFDVGQIKADGLGNLVLGNPDNSTDTDCPCQSGGSCPCNKYAWTSYCKFSGDLTDVQRAVRDVTVWVVNPGDTVLLVTVNDNCNTGFSDDSGVQQPCLTATASVIIRAVDREEENSFIYVSPVTGRDKTSGLVVNLTTRSLYLDSNASTTDLIYTNLVATVHGTGVPLQSSRISSYNGSARLLYLYNEIVPTNVTWYSINCGSMAVPCRSLQAAINQSVENSVIIAAPGVYSGPYNTRLDLDSRTVDIISEKGFNHTVIDCEMTGGAASFTTTANFRVVIDGFSIRNCESKSGGALVFRQRSLTRVTRIDEAGRDASQCQGRQCLATPVLKNCFLYTNAASSLGGAVLITEGYPVFEDCIFFRNSANSGGAVYIRGGAPVFRRCLFYGNIAETNGGALLINGGRTALYNCNFTMNAATAKGGAITVLKGQLEVFGCFITTNYAGLIDGGLHASGGEVSLASSFQDGNTEGAHANTFIDDIQTRRQQLFISQNGFQAPPSYQNPYKIYT